MKRTFHISKNKDVPYPFTNLFDEAFKNFYTNIMQEIENFAARGTPLEYTQHFTKDVQTFITSMTIALVCAAQFRVIRKDSSM